MANIFAREYKKEFKSQKKTILTIVFSLWFLVVLAESNSATNDVPIDTSISDNTKNQQFSNQEINDLENTNNDNLDSIVSQNNTISPENKKGKVSKKKDKKITKKYKYDKLQQLYLDLDPKMSYSDMIDLVKSTKLPYSEEKYNGSREIQVAFTDGCTAQKYKTESGDYLEIFYEYKKGKNSLDDDLKKYTFGTCVYNPEDSSLELICHVEGYYFSYSEPGNYISDFGEDLELDKNMSKKEQLKYYFENK